MKIIVTGGAGFIGSHLVDGYIKAGHRVAVIDNLATGFRRNLNPKATFYKADIRNLRLMEKIFQKERPEVVNHHAAIAEVVKSLRNPIPTMEVNVLGTTNVLLSFGKYGRGKKRKFLFSSTGGAIYGEPKKIPADEKTAVVPLSPYGLSKALGEEIIKFYARQYDFDYLIFRYPNVYGPRQNPKGEAGVVAIFGGLMRRGVRPTIFGDGTKARDYMYVGDIARANLIALRPTSAPASSPRLRRASKATAGKRGKNEILNLGWGKPTSDQMIFDAVAKELGFKQKPTYAPYRKGEVYRIAINSRRAKKILDWKPTVKLEDGIKKTLGEL